MTFVAWFSIGYGIVAIFAVRPISGALAWRMHRIYRRQYASLHRGLDEPTGEQWLGAIAGALFIVCAWPAVAVFWLQGRRDEWTIGPERVARLEVREQRVQQMEQELGIR